METSPEFARAAASSFAHKIIRERANIDRISVIAANELRSASVAKGNEAGVDVQAVSETDVQSISEDWLNVFENEAAQMGSEQMQHLFGKILAGEIRQPASYSIKTVKILAQLDNSAATLFRVLCSLATSVPEGNAYRRYDVHVACASGGLAELEAFGLTYGALLLLHEHGLIIADFYNTYVNYSPAVVDRGRTRSPLFTKEQSVYLFQVSTNE